MDGELEAGGRGGARELWRRSERDAEERLLWMTMGWGSPNWDWRSGVPSRLGLTGGVALGDVESCACGDEVAWG